MRSWAAFLCYLLALALALATVRPTGDGGEYLLSAHALAIHGTPDIRVDDAMWLSAREPRWRRLSATIAGGIQLGELTPLPSVRRAPSGRYYSLHFWFYSLLAVPFLTVTEHAALRPTFALALANGLSACAALAMLFRSFKGRLDAFLSALLFFSAGTTFYLGWTGAEVLTAAATLVACLAARRRELGLGILAAGIAAAQNPSAAVLAPYVALMSAGAPRPFAKYTLALVVGGGALIAFPYAFFYYEFRVPSLTARFATDPALISSARAWSLVFDLNEGMVVGVPGLLAGLVAVAFLSTRRRRAPAGWRLFTSLLATAVLVVGMAVPTFSIHNWNSGNAVFIRYAYWLAMPLFELALDLGMALAPALRGGVAALTALLQLVVFAANGVAGEHYNYLRHSWAARYVLERWPAAYNPVPEIFYERTLGREAKAADVHVVAWPAHGAPRKILVRTPDAANRPPLCPDGRVLSSKRETDAGPGWRYLNPPFDCKPP